MSFEANGFQLGDRFGEGIFGETFIGRLRTSEATVCAVKRLHSMAIDRAYVDESLTRLSRLKGQPGIVKVVGWNSETSPYWVASEFQGKGRQSAPTVSSLFRTFKNEEEAFGALLELATTLGALHGEGIVHGNLHPGNIFLAPEDSSGRLRIGDLGQAYIGSAHHVPITTETMRTLPPEQLLRPNEFRAPGAFRWDVYAYGVLAYRIMTGEWPRGQRYMESYYADCEAHHGGKLPLDVNRFVETLGDEETVSWFGEPDSEPCRKIREVISDCLSLRPEQRPRTGGDIQNRLAQIAHEIAFEKSQRKFAAERKVLKRKLFLTRAAALSLVSLLTLATLYGVTTLYRALSAEKQVSNRDGYMTVLGTSLAESNSAYAITQDQLLKSREAADRFFALLTRDEPLSTARVDRTGARDEWLNYARSYFDDALHHTGISWNSEIEAARGHHGLAHSAMALDDEKTSGEHFEKAVTLLEKLGEKTPTGELHAEIFERLGDCHHQLWIQQPYALSEASLGHLERSALSFQIALESRPEDTRLLLTSAAAQFYLGLHRAECQFARPALVAFSRSLELLALIEKLKEPSQDERFLAARAYISSGSLLKSIGRGPAALDAQVAGLGILLDLTSESPQKVDFEVDLARCYCELGELFQTVKDVEGAPESDPRQMLNEANRILLSVLIQSPAHARATVALARTYMGQSKLNREGGRTTEAMRLAKQAVTLLTELVAQHPENYQFPFQLAHHKVEYMQLLAAVARSQDAIKLGREASETLETLLDEHRNVFVEPVIKNYQVALANLHEQLGTLTEKASDRVLAAEHYARAVGYWELLASNYTSEEEFGERLTASRGMLNRVRK